MVQISVLMNYETTWKFEVKLLEVLWMISVHTANMGKLKAMLLRFWSFDVCSSVDFTMICFSLILNHDFRVCEGDIVITIYSSWVNERQIQTKEGKVDMSKALDASLVILKSDGIEVEKQNTSSTSGNDVNFDDADIKPVYDEETTAETSTMREKTMSPRSCHRWKPTGRIFKTIGLRWVPTRKIFTSSTTKVDSESPHDSNTAITNPHECKQTLDLSAGTSINVQKEQTLNLSARTPIDREKIKTLIIENRRAGRPMSYEITLEKTIEITARPKFQRIRRLPTS
nr:hypothetical protein [Tanacetum cinerariifolium]